MIYRPSVWCSFCQAKSHTFWRKERKRRKEKECSWTVYSQFEVASASAQTSWFQQPYRCSVYDKYRQFHLVSIVNSSALNVSAKSFTVWKFDFSCTSWDKSSGSSSANMVILRADKLELRNCTKYEVCKLDDCHIVRMWMLTLWNAMEFYK